VDPAPRLVAGSSPLVYDLASTLPDGIRRGGSFSVDASGAPLPVGVTLSAAGMLAASDVAIAGATAGVVFRYAEPA
jgi:hypothetical protein